MCLKSFFTELDSSEVLKGKILFLTILFSNKMPKNGVTIILNVEVQTEQASGNKDIISNNEQWPSSIILTLGSHCADDWALMQFFGVLLTLSGEKNPALPKKRLCTEWTVSSPSAGCLTSALLYESGWSHRCIFISKCASHMYWALCRSCVCQTSAPKRQRSKTKILSPNKYIYS